MPESSPENFVHLHVHSDHSNLDGACRVDRLVELAVERGQPAVALTDHGTISGLPKFEKACKAAGVKSLLGCELYLTEDRSVKKRSESTTWHLGVIARTNEGLRNLYQLTSRAYLEGYFGGRPRCDWELLEQYSEGIIAFTGCMAAPVMSSIFQGDITAARGYLDRLIGIFGAENVYGEIQNVGIIEQIPADSELAAKLGKTDLSQTEANRELAEMCAERGIKLVATGDVHYLRAEDATPHDALLCVGTGQLQHRNPDGTPDLTQRKFSLLPKRYYYRTEAEMAEALPEYPEALVNTLELAERCEASIEYGNEMLPRFPLPDGHDTDVAYLRHLCEEGMVWRYGPREEQTPEQRERLDFELGVIERMGYSSYFLIVWDLFREARERSIPAGPGRGSAAGSLVAYTLGITQLCPLKYDLLFERFLNPDRISMPDIDMDFSIERRGELIEYTREKYCELAGSETAVSQIVTHGMILAKAGLRDAARVLSKPLSLADRLAKMVPDRPIGITLRDTYKQVAEFRSAFTNDPEARQVIELAGWMEGFIRNEGIHAAGVVIWDQPLETAVPLQRKGDAQPITTAWDLKYTEAMGALKMDFLGLKNLDVIDRAIEIVKHTENITLDAYDMPLDDLPTYELLARGESIGVFQFESSGMRESLRLVGPTEFADLIALVALYRPGPMEYIPGYAARKQGREPVELPDERLADVIGPTYGIQIYQEQLMLTARQLGGFTPGEADTLRKAIGKKDADLMATLKPQFIKGCVENGVDKSVAEQLWSDNEKAAEYSFNKSHAACYAYIAYVTAYLKANHPAAYMAALLSKNADTKDKVPLFITEARRMGLRIRPPDLNRSLRDFAVMEAEDPKPGEERFEILFGLSAIKGVGDNVIPKIREERERGGPYRSLPDVMRRLPELNKTVLEKLILAGALDFSGHSRKAMLEAVEPMQASMKKEIQAKVKALIKATVAARTAPPSDDTLFATAGEKLPKPSAAEKKAIDKACQRAQAEGAVPAADEVREICRDAFESEALRLARAAARKDGLAGDELDARVTAEIAPGASERRAQADVLAPELSRWLATAMDAEAEDDDMMSAIAEAIEGPDLNAPDWDERERLNRERSVLGFFASGHPLQSCAREWRRYVSHTLGGLNGNHIGQTVTIVGAVTGERVIKKKSGERFGVELTVEDLTGSQPITFFDDRIDWPELIEVGAVSVFKAKVAEDAFRAAKEAEAAEHDEDEVVDQSAKAIKLQGIGAHPWIPEQVSLEAIRPLEIHITTDAKTPEAFARLREMLADYPGPSPVFVTMDEQRTQVGAKVQITPDLLRRLEELLGAQPQAGLTAG